MSSINIKTWYKRFNFCIEDKYLILLVLSGLHYEGKITDAKLKGQLGSLRKGTLEKYKHTYKCDIVLERWYNDESAYTIFEDLCHFITKDIPFENFIWYINMFTNKGFNYSINIFGEKYLKPTLNSWNPEFHPDSYADYLGGFYIPGIRVGKEEHYCYECGSKHYSYDNNETKNKELVSEWLHSKKKGNLSKIPYYHL